MILILQQVAIEGPGLFSIFLRKCGTKLQVVNMEKSQALPSLEECNGLVVLGGPMSVHDVEKYPFLVKEEAYLKQALKRKIPVLGVCLGAQLLAKALGAKVKKAPEEEIGWYDIWLEARAKEDLLLQGLDEQLKVFQWHQDTFELPKKAVLLAKGESCKNQAFCIGDYAWGLQFHPEMNKAQITAWLKHYSPEVEKDQIIYSYFSSQNKYLMQAKKICSNFLDVVEKNREKRETQKEVGR